MPTSPSDHPRAAILHGAAAALRANAADLRRFLLVRDGRSFDAPFVAILAESLDRIADLPPELQAAPLASLDGVALADMRHFLAESAPKADEGWPTGTRIADARERADVRGVMAMIAAAVRDA